MRRLEYSKVVVLGTMMPIHTSWLNEGVAPDLQRNYDVRVAMLDPREQACDSPRSGGPPTGWYAMGSLAVKAP